MPLFKKKPLIPPVVEQPALSLPSATIPRSSPSTYSYTSTASRDDAASYSSDIQQYNRNKGAGDVYSRGTAELDKDRNELFSGYNPAKSGSGRFFDGPDIKDKGEGDDDDIEGIKQQTRYVKQESVNSSRNALRLAREAERTGGTVLNSLQSQSEKLSITEDHLGVADIHAKNAKVKTDELKQLNRSIFVPVWKVKQVNVPPPPSHDTRKDPSDNHIGGGLPVGESSRGERTKEQRKLYQFEANASDDEMEDEIEDNLDEISEATSRLKALGMTMGQELDRQNVHINKIAKKTDQLDDGISATAARLKKIK